MPDRKNRIAAVRMGHVADRHPDNRGRDIKQGPVQCGKTVSEEPRAYPEIVVRDVKLLDPSVRDESQFVAAAIVDGALGNVRFD